MLRITCPFECCTPVHTLEKATLTVTHPPRCRPPPDTSGGGGGGVPGWGAALISIVLILVVGASGWVGFNYWRARVSYHSNALRRRATGLGRRGLLLAALAARCCGLRGAWCMLLEQQPCCSAEHQM